MRFLRSVSPVIGVLLSGFSVLLPMARAQPETGLPLPSPEAAGLSVPVRDVFPFRNDLPKGEFWNPFTTAFGDGTLALTMMANAENDPKRQRTVAVFFTPDNSVVEAPGHFDEHGAPWNTDNNTLRNNGNPPRIGADPRPGGTRYVIGAEATPWAFPVLFPSFGSPGNFAYDERVVSIQLLNKGGTLGSPVPEPVGRLIDPIYGHDNNGRKQQRRQLRSGLEIRCLSNGNFVVTVDDTTQNLYPNRAQLISILSATTGEVLVGPFTGNPSNPKSNTYGFSNLAAWKEGFAYRPKNGAGNRIFFWDNDGKYVGAWQQPSRKSVSDPLDPGEEVAAQIVFTNNDTRIKSDIKSEYVYMSGRGEAPSAVGGGKERAFYLTKIDAKTRKVVGGICITEGFQSLPDDSDLCVDAEDNVFVCWTECGLTGRSYPQVLGRLYDKDLRPRTEIFAVFQNGEIGPGPGTGFNVQGPSCSMVNGRILVAAQIKTAVESMDLTAYQHVATVLEFAALGEKQGHRLVR